MKLRLFPQVSALMLLLACDGGKSPAVPASQRARPSVQAAPQERDPLSLPERLSVEATQHPDAVQLVERALAGFEQDGVTFGRKRQVLARLLDAQYCQATVSGNGLGLSLCVFVDDEAAQRGRANSQARFDRLIPGRTLIAHDRMLLTLTLPANDSARREMEVIQQRFLHASISKHAAL